MDELVSELEKDGSTYQGNPVEFVESGKGRMKGHRYYEVKSENSTVLILSVYEGQPPHYRGWVELFSIEPEFYGSGFEKRFIGSISRGSGPGEKLFVEYQNDRETAVCLSRGYPAEVTRLGFLMFSNGYTWFKDWYFSEGFKEGGQKLQGEKPLNEEREKRHLQDISREIERFIHRIEELDEERETKRALQRAQEIERDVSGR